MWVEKKNVFPCFILLKTKTRILLACRRKEKKLLIFGFILGHRRWLSAVLRTIRLHVLETRFSFAHVQKLSVLNRSPSFIFPVIFFRNNLDFFFVGEIPTLREEFGGTIVWLQRCNSWRVFFRAELRGILLRTKPEFALFISLVWLVAS